MRSLCEHWCSLSWLRQLLFLETFGSKWTNFKRINKFSAWKTADADPRFTTCFCANKITANILCLLSFVCNCQLHCMIQLANPLSVNDGWKVSMTPLTSAFPLQGQQRTWSKVKVTAAEWVSLSWHRGVTRAQHRSSHGSPQIRFDHYDCRCLSHFLKTSYPDSMVMKKKRNLLCSLFSKPSKNLPAAWAFF